MKPLTAIFLLLLACAPEGSAESQSNTNLHQVSTSPGYEPTIAGQMLAENNRIRAAAGKPLQTLDGRLCRAAQDHAKHLSRYGYTGFGPSGHDGFGDGNVQTRAAACGFRGDLDENLGVNYSDIAHAFRCFSDPVKHAGHRRALLASHDVCGFGEDRNGKGQLIVVCVYGTESTAAAAPPGQVGQPVRTAPQRIRGRR